MSLEEDAVDEKTLGWGGQQPLLAMEEKEVAARLAAMATSLFLLLLLQLASTNS